ncbi:hypothetical protein [Dyadobacter koreensis]|nr:hypothetical protein [Dyadobacter koreensis]
MNLTKAVSPTSDAVKMLVLACYRTDSTFDSIELVLLILPESLNKSMK